MHTGCLPILTTASKRFSLTRPRCSSKCSPPFAVIGDLGMSLIKLANYEEAEGTRAGPYTDFGADARGIATESRRIGTVGSGVAHF